MKNVLLGVLGALIFATAGTVFAGNQQHGAQYFPLSKMQTYARSDGLFEHKSTKTLTLIGNGDGLTAIGPTYRQAFDGGDGVDIAGCIVPGTWVYTRTEGDDTGTNICAGTTPDAKCVLAFDEALADVGDVAACGTAASDVALCQVPDPNGPESCSTDSADLEGSSGNHFNLFFSGGVVLNWAPIVTQEIAPDMDADSLDVGGDQTDNDGMEVYGGIMGASGRPFVVGEDPAFEFCLDIAAADVSGTDDLHMGFRSVEPLNATFDNYDTLASIGLISGDIYIETIDDGGATTSTDTTQNYADGATAVEYCVLVSDAGVVTYTLDGQAPTTTAAYTFDDGIEVIPFFHFLQDSNLTGEVDLRNWEVTYQ